jgi:aminopeptidase N
LFADTPANYQIIDALHYTFQVEINDQNNRIKGHTSLLFRVKNLSLDSVYLDLTAVRTDGKGMKVSSVRLNELPVRFQHTSERLSIYFDEPLQPDYTASLHIEYQGTPVDGLIISENEYSERTFFGDNWPNRARHWLAVVDHPSDKATCEFLITAPQHYKVIANGTLREESLLSYDNAQQKKLTHWVMSEPIPTKVMVFGAARFAVLYDQEVAGVPIQHWVYADNRENGFKDFDPTANVLQFFIQKIGDYPYQKLANVESKTKYGGMENATNIFYNELAVDGKQNIEGLIAHEIAHQWFGNSVSEKDWPHIWLSEGFATYLSHAYMEHTYGTDSMLSLLQADKYRVFSYYNKAPESAVVDTKETNLFRFLNANSYQKGSWVLHMLRQKLGDDIFWKGLRTFYKQYCHANANTEDFKKVMEKVSGQSLDSFFEEWLYSPGHPVLKGTWKYSSLGKKLRIELQQYQENQHLYHLPIEIGVYYSTSSEPEIISISLDEKVEDITVKIKENPVKVVIDPNVRLLIDSHFTNR